MDNKQYYQNKQLNPQFQAQDGNAKKPLFGKIDNTDERKRPVGNIQKYIQEILEKVIQKLQSISRQHGDTQVSSESKQQIRDQCRKSISEIQMTLYQIKNDHKQLILLFHQLSKKLEQLENQDDKQEFKPIINFVLTRYFRNSFQKQNEGSSKNSIRELNDVQVSILIMGMAKINLQYINQNKEIWSKLEEDILQRFNSQNNISSQIFSEVVQSFSKTKNGSMNFWNEMANIFNQHSNRLDNLSKCICINSIGRSEQTSIKQINQAAQLFISQNINELNLMEILLVISGISSELSQKKSNLKISEVQQIFNDIALSVQYTKMSEINLKTIASLLWSYSKIDFRQLECQGMLQVLLKMFDNKFQYLSQKDQFNSQEIKNIILIAKSLTFMQIDKSQSKTFQGLFDNLITYLFHNKRVLSNLNWNEFNQILFSLSHDNELQNTEKYNFIIDEFMRKLQNQFEQVKAIKAVTSFALNESNLNKEFWIKTFQILQQNLNVNELDIFLQINLLWSLAKTKDVLEQQVVEDLKQKLVNVLTSSKKDKLVLKQLSISNLLWSLDTLDIVDDQILELIIPTININATELQIAELYSTMPYLLKCYQNCMNKQLKNELEKTIDSLAENYTRLDKNHPSTKRQASKITDNILFYKTLKTENEK
eukprot:403337759